MKYQPFAFWLVAIIVGILLQHFYDFNQKLIWSVLLFSCLIFSLIYFLKLSRTILFLSGFCVLICIGGVRYFQFNSQSNEDFQLPKEDQFYYLQVENQIKPSEKFEKYYAKILATENPSDSSLLGQKILVYLRHQPVAIHNKDRFWVHSKLMEIPSSQNPYAFDYQAYMKNKRVYFQLFANEFISLEHGKSSSMAHQLSVFKHNIKNELYTKGFSRTSIIFISSLALGDRSDLDREFQEKLSSAGVTHLFAISGLHVGIIFTFFMLILYPLLYLPNGTVIRWMIAIMLIWIYAWFVQFSPSVTRAAFMISFFYMSRILHKSSNLYHTLAVSAFVLLLIQPNQLFDVGFQMSYTAVFFIAWLFKPVRDLLPHYRKPYKNYMFDLFSITTVAQFGVLPISVFYFNKFSGLFLIGNLVILPFASVMVVLSLLTALALSLNIFPAFLVDVFNWMFEAVNIFIDFLTSFETFIFRGFTWNPLQVILFFTLLLLLRPVILKFRWKKLIPVFCVLLIFQLSRFIEDYQFRTKNEFIVFHQYKGSIIGVREGQNLNIFWNVEDSLSARNYAINPYVVHEGIQQVNIFNLMDDHESKHYLKRGNLMKIKDSTYYITHQHLEKFPEADVIILTSSPYRLPEQMPFKTKRIIADGSNYPSQVSQLEEKFEWVHSTQTKGAYLEPIH